MNLAFLKAWWKPLMVLVVIILPLVAAFHYYGKAAYEQHRAETAEHNLNLANNTITDLQTRQRDVAALDAKYTGELADAQKTIDQLERDVAAGKRRLLLHATCSRDGASLASGLGDATTPKLTGDAERNYWRLRDGIEIITGQVKYLQDYIKNQCVN